MSEQINALPGDVIDYGDNYREVVVCTTEKIEEHPSRCGCCFGEPTYKTIVWITGNSYLGEGLVEVILAGGGTAFVPAARQLHEWPPSDARVIRDGKIVWPLPGPEPRPAV